MALTAQATTTATHCPYCALQCAMSLTTGPAAPGATDPGRDDVRVAGRDFPTNGGGLCQKGWTSAAVLRASDRLTSPLLRDAHGVLQPVGWDVALDHVASRLRELQAEHGNDTVAVFGGGALTNEKAYALGKFARMALRTPFIDYNGRFCMSSAAAAGNRAFGLDRGLPFPLTDLAGAGAVLLLGSNLAETMPPAVQHLKGVRAAGGLVVVDPRRTPTAVLTDDGAGIHVQPLPGTDLAVLLGLLHVLWHSGGVDETYLAERVSGVQAVRESVALWWPERVERVSGVPAEQLRAVAELLIRSSPARGGSGAVVLTGRGAEQHAHGTDTVTAAINVALALGLPGTPGSGYGCLTGQGNGQGGREHGQKADQLPGYRRIDDPAARTHVAGVWGMDPDDLPGPGVPAVELLGRLGAPGGPTALLVHGSNLVVSAPDAVRVRERLAALDLLVVCDLVPSETALMADVVLPVAQWAEEAGTMTTLEGRVVRRQRALAPPPGVRTELEVLHGLAARLGVAQAFPTDPQAVFDELARASAGGPADYSGISYARLDAGEALFWPCPAGPDGEPHPGTPRPFTDAFPTPDGRARMIPVSHTPVHDDLRDGAGVYLVTGRVLQHYQSGAQTRRVSELSTACPEGFVQLHPHLAGRLGIEESDLVSVTSSRGRAVATAHISADVRPDTVFMPFHFDGRANVNRVTNPQTDPISGMPELKVCAVDVRREETAV